MNKRLLGKTGIEVSELSFGCVELGLPYGIGVKCPADMLPETKAVELLQAALDNGINFFDTARAYGRSEELIGRAFKDRRQDVVICTKCPDLRSENGSILTAKKISEIVEQSLRESLKTLATDYIDVYMLHNAEVEILNCRAVEDKFCDCRQRGLVRAIGVSTYSLEETKTAVRKGIWDVVELPFNLMDQRHADTFTLVRQTGPDAVGIVVRSVLLKGVLTDKGAKLHPRLATVQAHRCLYNDLLTDDVPTLFDLAIKFALSFQQVSSVLVGIDRIDYLRQALKAADGSSLPQNIIEKAKDLRYPDPDFLDLPKWDRLGWLR